MCAPCKPRTARWWSSVCKRLITPAKTYSYSIEQAPFPATDYLATIKVEAQGQGARVTWSGRFDASGVSEEEVVALFNGIYQGGLEALRANYPA